MYEINCKLVAEVEGGKLWSKIVGNNYINFFERLYGGDGLNRNPVQYRLDLVLFGNVGWRASFGQQVGELQARSKHLIVSAAGHDPPVVHHHDLFDVLQILKLVGGQNHDLVSQVAPDALVEKVTANLTHTNIHDFCTK